MPIGAYFQGHGNKVMRAMRKTYSDPKKAKSVFYATANARGQTADAEPGDTRTYTITAPAEVLNRFEQFLAFVQWCAGVGHSTVCGFSIDGDGADRFEVEEDLPEVKEDDVITRGSGNEAGGSYEMVKARAGDAALSPADVEYARKSGNWIPASGGTEEPFRARSGARMQYMWHPRSGKHAYLNLDTDIIMSDEEARQHLRTYDAKAKDGDNRARLHAALDKVMDRRRSAKDAEVTKCWECGERFGSLDNGRYPTHQRADGRKCPMSGKKPPQAEDAPAETYDPAQSKTGREAIRARLHATLDRCIDAVRGRRSEDGTSEGAMHPDKARKVFQEMSGSSSKGDFRMFMNQVKRDVKAEGLAKKRGYHEAQRL